MMRGDGQQFNILGVSRTELTTSGGAIVNLVFRPKAGWSGQQSSVFEPEKEKLPPLDYARPSRIRGRAITKRRPHPYVIEDGLDQPMY